MNFRVSGDLNVPFRIFPFVEEVNDFKVELTIKVRACFPATSHGVNVNMYFKVPRNTTQVHYELPKGQANQQTEYLESDRLGKWTIPKFVGGAEYTAVAKISL
jgi:AP-4 complex subunit mu-1